MIIGEIHGNILESMLQTLVVPVNTVGVMGAGLAKQFKLVYPTMFEAYQKACREKVFVKKGIFVFTYTKGRKILCLPTKRDWKHLSKIVWVDHALSIIARDYKEYEITSLAIPPIGCGLGGLEWTDVYPLIKEYLDPLDIDVEIYLP